MNDFELNWNEITYDLIEWMKWTLNVHHNALKQNELCTWIWLMNPNQAKPSKWTL